MITAEITIGEIIVLKGQKAAELIDEALCDDDGRVCCPGATLKLEYAAIIEKEEGYTSRVA